MSLINRLLFNVTFDLAGYKISFLPVGKIVNHIKFTTETSHAQVPNTNQEGVTCSMQFKLSWTQIASKSVFSIKKNIGMKTEWSGKYL